MAIFRHSLCALSSIGIESSYLSFALSIESLMKCSIIYIALDSLSNQPLKVGWHLVHHSKRRSMAIKVVRLRESILYCQKSEDAREQRTQLL